MGLGGDEEGEERRGVKESGWTEMKGERGVEMGGDGDDVRS